MTALIFYEKIAGFSFVGNHSNRMRFLTPINASTHVNNRLYANRIAHDRSPEASLVARSSVL